MRCTGGGCLKDETIKSLTAMSCITILSAIALAMGINGTLLSLGLAALAGLGGYALGKRSQDY